LALRLSLVRWLGPRPTLFVALVALVLVSSGCVSNGGAAGSPDPTEAATLAPVPTATVVAPASPAAPVSVHRTQVVVLPDPSAAAPSGTATSAPDLDAVQAAPTPDAYVLPESVDTVDKRLNVTLGGETTYIRNGGRLELGGDLAVEIYLDPYPPTALHSVVDLYLTREGEPVTDASIDVEFDMLSMAHGPFVATAKQIGGGHHLATLNYIMFGAWDQFVTIRNGLERIRFPVVIVAYP
jgi:hypothetical protein